MLFLKLCFQIIFAPVRLLFFLKLIYVLKKKHYIEITIDGSLEETPQVTGFLSYIKSAQEKYYDLFFDLYSLDKYLKKKSFAKIIDEVRFIIKKPQISWGRAWECRDIIESISTKVKTIAYIESGDSIVYYIALGCNEIYAPPSLNIDLLGFGGHSLFYKKLFDNLGIEPNFISVGDYKSAGESYTQKGHSKYAKKQLQDLLDNLKNEYNKTLIKSRSNKIQKSFIKGNTLDNLQKIGIFTTQDALKIGLVDGVLYLNQLNEIAKLKFDNPKLDYKSVYDILKLFRKRTLPFIGRYKTKKVAFVVGEGVIVDSDHAKVDSINYKAYQEAFQTIADSKYDAVVLRWNSPGGSAFVSDQLWEELQNIMNQDEDIQKNFDKDTWTHIPKELSSVLFKDKIKVPKKQKNKKDKDKSPIMLVSQSDVAASGGYYLSAVGDKIYASPLTITGSIGVLAGKFNITSLLNKVGVTLDLVESGNNGTLYSPFTNFSTSQKKRLEETMQIAYELFLDRIHKGRSLSLENLRKLGGGRVYSGNSAYECGLVDNLGGFKLLLDDLHKRLELKENQEIELEIYPRVKPSLIGEFLPLPAFMKKMIHFKSLEKDNIFYLDNRWL